METVKIIGIAADHAGFSTKEFLIDYLKNLNYQLIDFGTYSDESCDYPDYAHPLAQAYQDGKIELGFSICGSGNGINMVVNKYQKVRSALCWNIEIAKLARQHNNANICALPARFINFDEAKEIADAFLNATFEGGRHQKRIEKIPLH